jgi:HEAT repeat protein
VQREVVDALGSIGPEALPKLIEALQAQEPRERSGAVLALGAMHRAASGAAPAMLARLDSETDPTVRATLLTALPQIGADPAALVPRLVDGIKDEGEPIRHAAVNALLTLQTAQKQVVDALLTLLKDPNPAFQERAAYVLGRLGEYAAPAIPEIIATASRANAPPAFQDALVQIGAPAVPVILAGAEHVDEGNITPDFWAVKALKSMGGVAAIPVSHGLTHPNANARLLAVRVLGELGTDAEAAIPALIQRLDDPDLRVRASALSALIATHAPLKNLQPRLEIAIKDPSPLVRIAALEAVGKLGEDGRSLQAAVVAALREHEETIQRAALGVVGRVFPGAVEPTMALLGNQALRGAAIDALGRIGPAAKEAAEPLAGIARSQSKDDRLHALAAIAQIGPEAKEAATPSLRAACTDADPLIRAAAITATIQISTDDSERLAVLSVGLDDPEISVRKATADLVGKLGDKATNAVPQLLALVGKESDRPFISAALQQLPMRSVPALLELLEYPQRDVQILACEKLARLGRTARDATPTLETLAGDTDEDLSRAARRALRIINPR